ncbi:MAG: peptidoglycan editing factor PgeF [Nitrosomonas sp.]|nr:peptidoglycan editing factor PgeF [Nitrosomonas sp.]MCC7134790.1 peptidoglycan editing factor PgeF [Nitrosomonas sp.]
MMDWIVPEWPAPHNIKALFTTRKRESDHNPRSNYSGFNLGDHVGDNPDVVQRNRAQLCQYLPQEPCWLAQVHKNRPIWVDTVSNIKSEGDAAISRCSGVVCAILVADCLPVFLCDEAGSVVAIAHAGWRGLASGIIENTIREMRQYSTSKQIIAWLGPAIGPQYFEVGEEVRSTFIQSDSQSVNAFTETDKRGKYYADIFQLARQRLAKTGVDKVFGGELCTFSDADRFYSYRRDGQTGRMAALLWMTSDSSNG